MDSTPPPTHTDLMVTPESLAGYAGTTAMTPPARRVSRHGWKRNLLGLITTPSRTAPPALALDLSHRAARVAWKRNLPGR